jgi:hypothetical protein
MKNSCAHIITEFVAFQNMLMTSLHGLCVFFLQDVHSSSLLFWHCPKKGAKKG